MSGGSTSPLAADGAPIPSAARADGALMQGDPGTVREHTLPVVPARMVNEVLYCERLAYLEWIQGEFADNHFTVEGRTVTHRHVDAKEEPPAAPDDERPWKARSVWLTSERLQATARIDIVEADEEGCVAPVEYKRGRKPKVPGGAWLPERAQLCVQVLLLREHGYRCDAGWIWFAQSRDKVVIEIDDELISQTTAAISRMQQLARAATLPPPLDADPKCRGCSLSNLCLPDEVNMLRGGTEQPQRRLQTPLNERAPLYVQEQGAKIGISKNRLQVIARNGDKQEQRLFSTSHVCVYGYVQVSTQAIRALLRANTPLVFYTTGGWYLGRTIAEDTNNVELRAAQYELFKDEPSRLKLARAVIRNKILNQRTLLRRNHTKACKPTLFELKQLAKKASHTRSRQALLGIEGTAARSYFGAFTGMLKTPAAQLTFNMAGRNRRPPQDPVNALLSFTYSLLVKDWALTLRLASLDPLLGFLHEPRFGRPALALDLMEPFRPLIADSVVLTAINNKEVTATDFIVSPVGCMMKAPARKRIIAAYERRMAQLLTHPIFGYRISYRRTMEVQARLFGRHLLGEIPEYPDLRTR